jgi:acetyl-CoA carboxylase biotin carboxyl carrier protein
MLALSRGNASGVIPLEEASMAIGVEQAAGRIDETQPPAPAAAQPFTLDLVKALVKALEGTDVTSLRWNQNGQRIVIRRGEAPAAPPVAHHAPAAAMATPAFAPPPPAPAAPAHTPPAAPKAASKPGTVVTSPLVGTFYRAPSPDSAPFVEVGSVVKKGQVLCIVEAMKLMNELQAEGPGRITEILVANATMVELAQPLFHIEPA